MHKLTVPFAFASLAHVEPRTACSRSSSWRILDKSLTATKAGKSANESCCWPLGDTINFTSLFLCNRHAQHSAVDDLHPGQDIANSAIIWLANN